jgi:hypothetical protein
MRILIFTVTFVLFATGVSGQEATLSWGFTDGYFYPRSWIAVQDRRTDATAQTYAIDLRIPKWRLSGSLDRQDESRAWNIDLRATPFSISKVCLGVGTHYADFRDAHPVFSGSEMRIIAANRYQLLTGYLSVGIGTYNRSSVHLIAGLGALEEHNNLELWDRSRIVASPLDTPRHSAATFSTIGAEGTFRIWWLTTDSAVRYLQFTNNAVLANQKIVRVNMLLMTPLHIGASAQVVRVFAPETRNIGAAYLNNSFTVSIAVRVP